MVTLGESHTAGASATRRDRCWANLLKALIDGSQHSPVTLVNRGLGADIVSKKCPAYKPKYEGQRPIGMERYRKHVIEEDPDLVIISYGYNDMRGGTPLDAFLQDMQTVVDDIKKETRSVMVLLDTYYIPKGGFAGHGGSPEPGESWDHASPEGQALFNQAIAELARKGDTLFASIFDAMGCAEWAISDPSGKGDIHANDLGHRLVANRVFEVLATNCSCLSTLALEQRSRVGKSPWRHVDGALEPQLVRDFFPQ
jgi:lysophospholipase L1-like esterase